MNAPEIAQAHNDTGNEQADDDIIVDIPKAACNETISRRVDFDNNVVVSAPEVARNDAAGDV